MTDLERLGWVGIGVPVHTVETDRAFVALGIDPTTGNPALSVWRTDRGLGQRDYAMWMTPEAASKLAFELSALARGPRTTQHETSQEPPDAA